MKKLKVTEAVFLEAIDPEGKDWKVCLIATGTSKNGFTYPKETLEKAVPLFEGAKACAYDFGKVFKHLPDSIQEKVKEGFPKSICGWYSNVHFGEFKDATGEARSGVLADFHVAENAIWLRQLMKDAWTCGKSILGLSIDAGGVVQESANEVGLIQRIVQELKSVTSVDVVTFPSAGGAFLRLVAADEKEESPITINWEVGMKKYIVRLYEMLLGLKSKVVEGIDPKNISDEQGATLFSEAMSSDSKATLAIVETSIKEGVAEENLAAEKLAADKKAEEEKLAAEKKAAEEKLAAEKLAASKLSEEEKSKLALKESIAEVNKLKEDATKLNCETILKSALASSELPVPLQENIKEQFNGKVFEAKELDSVIMKSKDMLAKLSESGDVKNVGGKVEIKLMESDKKQAALDKLIDPKATVAEAVKGVGAFRGIKEAYIAYTGDHEVTGHIDSSRLTESMGSTDFSYALGTSMTRKLAKEYGALPTTWQLICPTPTPIKDFKTQEIIRFGGFGRLPVVAEKGTYTDLGGGRDERATYAATKKGGMAYVTREMIKNDDLRFLLRIPKALARAAAETLEYYVWNPILSNATIYDGSALGTLAHGNYGTAAFDGSTLSAAKLRMRKQKGEGSVLMAGTSSTTGSTTTLVDTTLTQFGSAQELAGKYVRMIYGPGAGQTSLISSHTADTLTFAAVATAPTAATLYQISVASATDVMLGLKAKYLIVGPTLEATANILLQSERIPGVANNDINIHKGTMELISPLHLTDATDWFLAADPAMIDLVEVGFIDGNETPELLLQDNPAAGTVFTNDMIAYKVRHEYGVAIPDYRGWDVDIVAG